MKFSVTKLAPELIIPAELTPAETLPLSSFDQWLPTLRYIVIDMVLVFGPDVDEPANVIKKALAKALVDYYPVAGRIVQDSKTGKLEIDCRGEGVWFVEASAEFRLEDVECLETSPPMMSTDQLFPCPPPEVSLYDLPLLMQVTKFKCGGFTLAFRFNHAIFDGRGIGQFVKSVSEIAEGDHSHPPIKPVWCREVLPVSSRLPPGIPPLSTMNLKTFKFEHLVMDISMYAVNTLKNEYTESTGQNCTAFEILAAKIWQCRTRAIEIAPDVDVNLTFGADVRKLQSVLPAEGGYYGNCIYNVLIRAPSATIAHGSLADIVNLIKNSKEILQNRMTKWLEGDAEEDPYKMGMGYGSLLLTDWRRTGIFDAEFGSRKPFHATPVGDGLYFGTCGLLNSPEPKQAARLLMTCVSEEHLKAFHDELKAISHSSPSLMSSDHSAITGCIEDDNSPIPLSPADSPIPLSPADSPIDILSPTSNSVAPTGIIPQLGVPTEGPESTNDCIELAAKVLSSEIPPPKHLVSQTAVVSGSLEVPMGWEITDEELLNLSSVCDYVDCNDGLVVGKD